MPNNQDMLIDLQCFRQCVF